MFQNFLHHQMLVQDLSVSYLNSRTLLLKELGKLNSKRKDSLLVSLSIKKMFKVFYLERKKINRTDDSSFYLKVQSVCGIYLTSH